MGEDNFTYRHKNWSELSMREKADMMKVAIRNGITKLSDIKAKYNEFAEGGNTVGEFVNALYENNPREEYLGEPSHHYDFTQSEEWANAHGYYPDARGHRDDRVKKVSHPSHPSRGIWDKDKFVLSDFGMETPNYTLFGLNDGGQDSQAVLTYKGGTVIPEITVTPNGNYVENPYDNIRLHYANGGKIHIKKENRGKFTALKERTGHSASWFKEHGTPAQKKMAVFALNSRHWNKHGLGGHLFDGNSELVNVLYRPEENVVHRVTRVNGNLVGMDPVTGRFYDNTTGNYIGDHVALEDIVVTPQNGTIDDMGNIYQNIGGVTHMTTSDGRHIILGEKPVSNVDPVGEFYVEGTALSPLFKPAERVVSGVLGAPEIVKSGREIMRGIINTANKKALDTHIFNDALKQTVNNSSGTDTLKETVEAAENGRQALLDAVNSAWNRVRWQTAMPGKNVDIFIKDLSQKVKEVPFDYSKSTKELGAFGTVKPHEPKITTIGNTQIRDYNTGLDVYVGSDLGEAAYPTSIHEPIHYMTSSSNGEPAGYISDGLMGKSYKMYNLPEGNTGIILRGKGYEHKMVDYNDNLLPPVDQHSAAYMAINEPSKLKDILVRNGRSSEEAESLVQSVSNHYRYMLDKQENQTYLKEFFLDKIKPHLKNPNDATEIENYLKAHPDIIENNEYIKELMTSTRPGSTEDYSKALAKMLYTITGATAVSGLSNTVKSE